MEEDREIIRRIPPDRSGHSTTIFREGAGRETATSFALQPKPDEDYPSWSYAHITTPQKLIAIEASKRESVAGWRVVAVPVGRLESIGLFVEADPTEEDPGHCLIKPIDGGEVPKKIWSKLALLTRIVHTER